MDDLTEFEKEDMKALMEALKKMPTWIDAGKMLIYPQMYKEWEKAVKDDVKSESRGIALDDTLTVMRMIEDKKPLEETVKFIDGQNFSGSYLYYMLFLVTKFSKQGPQFYRDFIGEELPQSMEEHLQKIEKQNEIFEQQLKQNNSEFSD